MLEYAIARVFGGANGQLSRMLTDSLRMITASIMVLKDSLKMLKDS